MDLLSDGNSLKTGASLPTPRAQHSDGHGREAGETVEGEGAGPCNPPTLSPGPGVPAAAFTEHPQGVGILATFPWKLPFTLWGVGRLSLVTGLIIFSKSGAVASSRAPNWLNLIGSGW